MQIHRELSKSENEYMCTKKKSKDIQSVKSVEY